MIKLANITAKIKSFMLKYTYIELSLPTLILFIMFFILPILLMMSYSFYHSVPGGGMEKTLTLENFMKFFSEPYYFNKLIKTLYVSILVVIFCIVISYPVAYFLARTRTRYRLLLTVLLISPILIGGVIRAYGWMILLGNVGVINRILLYFRIIQEPIKFMFSTKMVIIGLVHPICVFMILCVMSVIKKIDPFLEEAAMDLGANRLQTFIEVILPLSIPGVVAGSTLGFTLSMSSFVIPQLLGGGAIGMMGPEAYRQIIDFNNWPFGAVITAILVLTSISVMILYNKLLQRSTSIRGYV